MIIARKYIKVSDLAQMLDLPKKRIYKLINRQQIKANRIGRTIRVSIDEVNKLIQETVIGQGG